MMRISTRMSVPALAGLTLAWAALGPAQDTGKRVGEKLDDVGREIRGGLNRAGQGIKDQFAAAKTSVEAMGVESRVYGRLHWDKALNEATIELAVTGGGVVTLSGSVNSAKAKTHAVELARETVGVTEVVDKLAIEQGTTRVKAPASRP